MGREKEYPVDLFQELDLDIVPLFRDRLKDINHLEEYHIRKEEDLGKGLPA